MKALSSVLVVVSVLIAGCTSTPVSSSDVSRYFQFKEQKQQAVAADESRRTMVYVFPDGTKRTSNGADPQLKSALVQSHFSETVTRLRALQSKLLDLGMPRLFAGYRSVTIATASDIKCAKDSGRWMEVGSPAFWQSGLAVEEALTTWSTPLEVCIVPAAPGQGQAVAMRFEMMPEADDDDAQKLVGAAGQALYSDGRYVVLPF